MASGAPDALTRCVDGGVTADDAVPDSFSGSRGGAGYFADEAAVFVFQWAAMAALVMHVQVATRFLSSCPCLYWYGAHLCRRSGRWRLLIWGYCLCYMLLGALMFTNFYPWT